MAIVNADFDASSQKRLSKINAQIPASGAILAAEIVPDACVIVGSAVHAAGLSGTPTAQLGIKRFIVGAGATTISVGGALTLVEYGTSGVISSFSLPASGSTLLLLQKNDVLVVTTGGSNAGALNMHFDIVIQELQSYLSWY